jgi:hypothetical protein
MVVLAGRTVDSCPARGHRTGFTIADITTGPFFLGVNRNGNVATARLSDEKGALVVKD